MVAQLSTSQNILHIKCAVLHTARLDLCGLFPQGNRGRLKLLPLLLLLRAELEEK